MNKKNAKWFLALFVGVAIAFSLNSCEKDELDPPTVTTEEVTQITSAGATSGGTVMADGGAEVTARGVVWSTSANPTVDDNKTTDGTGVGRFTSVITGLEAETTYYVRAYATNEAGTAYGEQREFTTVLGADAPAVTTVEVSMVARHTAESGGEVTSDGGSAVTARGVVYGTSQGPTIDDNKTEDGQGMGEFESALTGLDPNTTYYVRAYAVNDAGVSYGEEFEFTTWPEDGIVDAQGNVYSTVVIGDQEWMAENLRITIFNNGEPIPGPNHEDDWVASGDNEAPAWASFMVGRPGTDGIETDEQMVEAYGLIYNWFTAVDERGICPTGWVVPDTSHFRILRAYVIENFDDVDGDNVGNALKAARQIDHPWGGEYATEVHPRFRADGTHFGTDVAGFKWHAQGTISSSTGVSSWIGRDAGLWTAVDHEQDDRAYFRRVRSTEGHIGNFFGSPRTGHGIRCVKAD